MQRRRDEEARSELERLNTLLPVVDQAHLLRLLRIHFERSVLHTRKKLVLDDLLVVEAEQKKGEDDFQLRTVRSQSPGKLPSYASSAIKWISDVFDQGPSQQRVAWILASNYELRGGAKLGRYAAAAHEAGLALYFTADQYPVTIGIDPRTQTELQEINHDASRREALLVSKLLFLCGGVFSQPLKELTQEQASTPITLNSPLQRLSVGGDKRRRFFHGSERDVDCLRLANALAWYQKLSKHDKIRFQRALYWIGRQEFEGVSDVLLHAAFSIECLVKDQEERQCEHCGQKWREPSATRAFRDLISEFSEAGGGQADRLAKRLYTARSEIAHAGVLSSVEDPGMLVRHAFTDTDHHTELHFPALWVQGVLRDVLYGWLEKAARYG